MVKQKKPIPLPKLDLTDKKQGFVVLLSGIVLALILGGFAAGYGWAITWIYSVLVIGIIVGILNIFHEEGILFLIAGLTITFMLNILAGIILFPIWTVTIFNAIIYLLAPASIVVGIKVLYALATK